MAIQNAVADQFLKTTSTPAFVNVFEGFTTTATAAGTTALLASSTKNQEFTGVTTQTVTMPVSSTLVLGQQFYIINNSTGAVTVQSSGGNSIQVMADNTSLLLTCILTSGTGIASWQSSYLTDAGISPPGASGTILRSNGTAWIASTSTFADTYSASTLLYSNGANTVTGLAASARGVLVSDNSSVPSMLASASTTGQILQGSTTGAPTWSTPTYPSTSGTAGTILRSDGTNNLYTTSTFADTYAVSTILYASSSNTVSGLATANRAVLTTGATGVPALTSLATDGQVIIGSTAGAPAAATLTPGTGISIANAGNSITISATGGGFAVATISGTTQSAAVNTMYIALNAGQTTVTLPAVYSVGDSIILVGSTANTGGWIITASAGDTVRVLNSTTSAGGTVTSTAQAGESIEIVCDVANTSWVVKSFVSTLLTTA